MLHWYTIFAARSQEAGVFGERFATAGAVARSIE
jgi:hypothetical protein